MIWNEILGQDSENRIYGVVPAIVTNNKDPEQLGRIKVKFSWLSEQDESNWCRIACFIAGNRKGSFFLPEVGDEVLVVFEHGDISRPYILGVLWNGVDKPPADNSDGKNTTKMIQTKQGLTILFDEKEGEEKIIIKDKTAKNKIEINLKDKKILIQSEKDISISAKNGKISLEAKEIEMKSSAATKFKSQEMKLESSGNMKLKGATINLN